MSSAAPIKIAIIGTGIFAYRHLKAFRTIGNKFEIVACCNRSREKAEKFAKEVSCKKKKNCSGYDVE